MGKLGFRDSLAYRIAVIVLLAAASFLLIRLAIDTVVHPAFISVDDYATYWSSARLQLAGEDPYDLDRLKELQIQAGRTENIPQVMWNPPWIMTLVMPFGLLPYPVSRLLWLLSGITIAFGCASLSWRMHAGSHAGKWIAWLVAFTYAPLLQALRYGQIAPFILLGVLGFLHFTRKRAWFIAGLFAALMTIKPHLLLLLGLALVVWTVDRQAWRFFLGGFVAIVVVAAVAWAVNPRLYGYYLQATRTHPPTQWATPTIGGGLRLIFGVDRFWLQFLPAFLGVGCFIWYWRRHRESWDWVAQAPVLLLVSVLMAPYGWTYDYAVALPTIMQAMMWIAAGQTLKSGADIGLLIVYAIVDGLALFTGMQQFRYWWLVPLLTLWYLSVRALSGRRTIPRASVADA